MTEAPVIKILGCITHTDQNPKLFKLNSPVPKAPTRLVPVIP